MTRRKREEGARTTGHNDIPILGTGRCGYQLSGTELDPLWTRASHFLRLMGIGPWRTTWFLQRLRRLIRRSEDTGIAMLKNKIKWIRTASSLVQWLCVPGHGVASKKSLAHTVVTCKP